MSFGEIEAELDKLAPDQLRRLALLSWTAYLEKESRSESANDCSEEDQQLLAALDAAVRQADAAPARGYSAEEVRSHLSKWISR